MLGAIVVLPLLGITRFGRVARVNIALWLVIVALGLMAAAASTTFDTAVKHQLVTLYLAAGAFALAGYIAADPEPRARLVLTCYVGAALVATLAGLAGSFSLLPEAYELFTSYGRARGTFKDPNVYGAAIAPAIVACGWVVLRERGPRVAAAALTALVLAIGMLLSFSRGAWLSLAVSLAALALVIGLTSRCRADLWRLKLLVALGGAAIAGALLAVLQVEQVNSLLEVRASLEQSYDLGPEGRFGGQAKAGGLILESPLGIGTHTFRDIHHPEEPHNVYLSMFLNAGWLGGLLYIVSIAATLAVGLAGALRPGPLQGPMLIASTALLGAAVEGCVIDSDHWRSFFILLGCVWGLADAPPPGINASRRRGN